MRDLSRLRETEAGGYNQSHDYPARNTLATVSFMLSARNQFKGKVKSVKLGGVMAEVVIQVGKLELVSVITRESAERMALAAGKEVTAVIKSTEILIATD
jgi:molybdopterin-binding protein